MKILYGENRTLEGVAQRLLDTAKSRCKKKGGSVTITRQWIEQGIQRGCEETGLQFCIGTKGTKSMNNRAPSLDRIDSSNPDYSIENTRVVCYQVNIAKSNFSDAECYEILFPMVQSIQARLQSREKNVY
jgi:hypothetical protein